MTTERAIDTNKLAAELTLSASPEKAMQEMMEAIDGLRDVYAEETEALQQIDTMKFLKLQDKKITAARNYQSGIDQILKRRDEFKSTPEDVREELKKKQEEFSALATANIEALDRMHKTVRRLGERVMNAAREAAIKNSPNYSSKGSMNHKNRGVSIGINESA